MKTQIDKTFEASFLDKVPFFNIDWSLLAKASEYYQRMGFIYQTTPYAVPVSYGALTKPHDDPSFILNEGIFHHQPHELVGSAEQGFIYMALQNQLLGSKLYSVSPCFRTDNYDLSHSPWFMKLELFELSSSIEDCQKMIHAAIQFFSSFVEKSLITTEQTGEKSWDININGIEVGSYGVRELPHIHFIYGTGLALPRFSLASL